MKVAIKKVKHKYGEKNGVVSQVLSNFVGGSFEEIFDVFQL